MGKTEKPVEDVLETSIAKTRLSSPFTDDTGGIRADGYQLVTILTYHAIREKPRSLMHITPEDFEEQMAYLKENNFNVISIEKFFEFVDLKRGLPEKSVVITFDDGWRSVYTKAYPILRKYGLTATIFVYTDFLSSGNKSALTWEMMKEMREYGMNIQVHSKTHALKIPWKKQGETEKVFMQRIKKELADPKAIVEKNLGKTVNYIAYPYGQYNDFFIKSAKGYGYEGGLTVFGATAKEGIIVRKKGNPVFTDPFEVNRVQVLSGTKLNKFIKKLRTFKTEKIYDGQYDHLFGNKP